VGGYDVGQRRSKRTNGLKDLEQMDSDGGGESNDSNDDEQMEGDEENDNSIDEDNRSNDDDNNESEDNDSDGSEDEDNDFSEDDDDDVSDDESVDTNEIDEQLNSDDLKHFMLQFHKGTYDDELKNAIEIDKLLYDNNLGVNLLFADIPSARIGILKTRIHQRINEVESNQGNYNLQIVVRKNANGQIVRVIWHDPTLDEYWEKLFIALRKKTNNQPCFEAIGHWT
jgi:cobalamin biosynthesis protein CobT